MKKSTVGILFAAFAVASVAMAQAPSGGRGGAPRPALSVTSTSFADGAEMTMRNAGRGENKSPAFEFHWTLNGAPTATPDTVQTYAITLRDIDNATNKTTVDTLHWSIFNIPGSAKGIAEGLAAGDLADGSRNGPGIGGRGGNPPAYFGPAAPAGPFHHYVFEFFALDSKLDLPATATRDELIKAMDGHVVGKTSWVGRFHAAAQ